MHLSASCVCALLISALFCEVTDSSSVSSLYGETVAIPCKNKDIKAEDIIMTKWKYDKGQGLSGDLLVRQTNQDAKVSATDEYKDRVSMAKNSSLLLSAAKLSDQRTFICMVVTATDVKEYPINLEILKVPAGLKISDKAEELAIGKLTKLGTCVAQDTNPAAKITWLKNNKPLEADGKRIVINQSLDVDPASGLSTTKSTLEYSAEKEDTDAQFACSTGSFATGELVSPALTLTITYSTENIVLQVNSQAPVVEGDNMTLKCVADGNPAPTSFNFHLKGELVKVENADTYTIVNVSRNATGEYKCSLTDDPSMEASRNITVSYLDINLSPAGRIGKPAGDPLDLTLQIDSSAKSKVSWTKDYAKLDKEPKFTKLAYSDSGFYECEVTMGPLSRKAFFELVVEGAPVIKKLSKQRTEDGKNKVLICEAEGSPKPAVSWSINGSLLTESPFVNGRITHKITVAPSENLTVSCTVSNVYGTDRKVINVSPYDSDSDQTKLVVGVVVGLLVAAVVIGLAYWVYMKKSKQGSWKTGEKEDGSSEEEKKLEEKVEENSQKAEV
ncbi:CD166 antigen homolog A-like isoform 2-T2 [Odontesthes bonariensis]|uniref:CD166 antigen homolog A-like isoform X2 n=1 Tax=Odontesthes bonariensis TaxID=219752 RepID=UPI003F58ED1E